MKSFFALLTFASFALVAEESFFDEDYEQTITIDEPAAPYVPPPHAEIEQELAQAEKDFETAKKMFNPWYAGPLITGGASNMDPGFANIQPYLYLTNTFAEYDKHRNSKNIQDIWSINPLYLFQTGITNWLDTTLVFQADFNNQGDQWGKNVGDTSLGFGFQLYRETAYVPGFRITASENFPTGRYDKLDPNKNGIDATGSGAYETTFTFNMAKVIWWLDPLHPFSLRLNLLYTFSAPTTVREFNAYGGGFGTDGKVKPGSSWGGDFAIEYSFTQRWVAALDIVYQYFNSTSFSGTKGVDELGNAASVGGPSGDSLSFAPAIEYNPSESFGYVAGVWFTGTGRNSSNFVSLIFTFYAVF